MEIQPMGPVWHFTTAASYVNQPPAQPSDPDPVNGAENQDTTVTLSWSCSDPDSDPLLYDIYFGTNSNPPMVSSDQSNAFYNPGSLNSGTTYYWKITAKDDHGNSTAGTIWHFATVLQSTNNFATVELRSSLRVLMQRMQW